MRGSADSIPRRVFLKDASLLSALAMLNASGCAGARAGRGVSLERLELEEPGPMIPPVPAILLTVQGKSGDPDEISVVWTFVVNGEPPQVGISVHEEHRARDLVAEHGEFVLNLPTVDLVKGFDVVDMNSRRVADKFALSGFTRTRAARVKAPAIEESPIHVECRTLQVIDLPPVRTIFLAEVIATRVHKGVCDDKGRLIVSNVPFFGMTAGSGEFYTMGQLVGHIGQSVGRSDIKY
jgi:flavin reductase (DIM6/NTAB) family NADH-FMN oxidoreductase RutF